MAHRAVPRCGFPALAGCPVSIFRPAISIHLKQPAFKWNMRARALVLRAASNSHFGWMLSPDGHIRRLEAMDVSIHREHNWSN
jgi:hypothetical protein